MKIHQLVIGWIYFYRNALAYDPPIEITVGVGQEKYEVYIHNEHEYIQSRKPPKFTLNAFGAMGVQSVGMKEIFLVMASHFNLPLS